MGYLTDLTDLTSIANLKAQTEVASANSKGFVSSDVVNPNMAENYQHDGYTFCLRDISEGYDDKLNKYNLTSLEAYSIMQPINVGGSGLSLMPLYKVRGNQGAISQKEIKTKAVQESQIITKLLHCLGLPLGVTIWLDIESINALESTSTKVFTAEESNIYLLELSAAVISSGFSVGYYYGNTHDCACPSGLAPMGTNVLQAVACANGMGENHLHTITIGDNADSCKIRWAYYS
ncbi:MAG: hypothetical protein ACI96W_002408 [Paraglaciecola sp.]|jgi:hypothetical protein